jgi:molybdenum cofactor biosynthesis protein B
MSSSDQSQSQQSLGVAVLTVSDTRTEQNDTSGQFLVEGLQAEGHQLIDKQIVIDDVYLIRAAVSQWIADPAIQSILVTGGTGFTGRDSTPEAISVLFDKTVEGFGELFRYLSYDEIGTSTVQSRALAGLANETVIFCMPGSTGACKTAWGKIIREQLDSRHRPCNFVGVLKTRAEQQR